LAQGRLKKCTGEVEFKRVLSWALSWSLWGAISGDLNTFMQGEASASGGLGTPVAWRGYVTRLS
jgi:hypothetical protein